MAVTADSVIVELQAKVDKYEADMRRAAQTTDGAMKGVAASTARAEAGIAKMSATADKSLARTQNATRNLGRQISDIGTGLATGQNPFFIIAQQSGQVADALADTGGRAASVAAFFAGPWGAALLTAGSALGVLVGKYLESDDAAERAEKKTYDFTKALDVMKLKASDTSDAMKQLVDATKKFIEIEGNFDQQVASNAINAVSVIEGKLRRAEKEVRDLEDAATSGPAGLGAYLTGIRDAEKKVKALKSALEYAREAANNVSIGGVQRDVLDSLDEYRKKIRGIEADEGKLEQRRRASLDAERLPPNLRNYALAKAGFVYLSEDAYKAELTRLEKLKKKIEEDRAEARSADRASSRSKPETATLAFPVASGRISSGIGPRKSPGGIGSTNHAGLDIPVPVGTPVSAGGAGVVISTGTLPGYGKTVIVDYGGGTIAKYAHLSQSLVQKGQAVNAGDVIARSGNTGKSTGPHLHYEVRTNDRVVDPRKPVLVGDTSQRAAAGADSIQREAERAMEEAKRNADRYADTIGTLDAKIAQLGTKQIVEIEDQIAAAKEMSDAERAKRDAAYERLLRDGEITDKQLEELKFRSNYINALERLAITMDGKAKIEQEEREKAGAIVDLRIAQLMSERDQTDSAKRKAEIDKEIVKAKNELLIAAQQAIIDDKNASAAQKAAAQARIDAIRAQQSAEIYAIDQSNKGALQSYADRLKSEGSKENIERKIEDLIVQELDYVRDSISNAITKQLGIKDPLLAGLVDMLVQEILIKPLAEALSNMNDAGGGGGLGGFFSSIGNAIGSIFGGGARASGGNVVGGSAYLVGERGPELFAPAGSGKIYPTGSLQLTSGGRMGNGGGQTIIVDAKGAVMNDQFARMILDRAKQMDVETGRATYKKAMTDAPTAMAKVQRYG